MRIGKTTSKCNVGYLVGEGAVWEDLNFVIGGQRHVQGGPGGCIMAEALADVSRCQRGRPISQQVVQHSLHASTNRKRVRAIKPLLPLHA